MEWALLAASLWMLCAVILALFVGRAIRMADRRAARSRAEQPNFVVDDGQHRAFLPARDRRTRPSRVGHWASAGSPRPTAQLKRADDAGGPALPPPPPVGWQPDR